MPPGNSVAEGRSATVCAGRVKVTYDNWRRKHPVQGFRLNRPLLFLIRRRAFGLPELQVVAEAVPRLVAADWHVKGFLVRALRFAAPNDEAPLRVDCRVLAGPAAGALGALVAQFVDVTARLWPRCGVPRAVEHMHNKPHMRVTATNGLGDEAARGPFPHLSMGPLAPLVGYPQMPVR